MRVLIIADASFAARERPMLARLEVGLVDEGARVVRAIPQRVAERMSEDVYSRTVTFSDHGNVLTRSIRAGVLAARIAEMRMAGGSDRPVDVVHAMGGRAWQFAAEVAKQTRASLAVDVWRGGLVAKARSLRDAFAGPFVAFAPDASMERALKREGLSMCVRCAPWGVHLPAEPVRILAPDDPISILIAGTGRSPDEFRAAVEGAALAAQSNDHIMIFVDAEGARRAAVWPLARRLNVLDRLSLVPEVETRRKVTLRTDILSYPDARGEQRTFLLDAMAVGVPIVASADPMISALTDGRTARLIEAPDPRRWESVIVSLIEQPDTARTLGASARDFIKAEHRVSAHVSAVLDAYEWMTVTSRTGT